MIEFLIERLAWFHLIVNIGQKSAPQKKSGLPLTVYSTNFYQPISILFYFPILYWNANIIMYLKQYQLKNIMLFFCLCCKQFLIRLL